MERDTLLGVAQGGGTAAMQGPINPPPVAGGAGNGLPAYLSNGVVGLKVRDNPLTPGMTLLSGFSGEHPNRRRHLPRRSLDVRRPPTCSHRRPSL